MIGICNDHIRMPPNRPSGQMRRMHGSTRLNEWYVWHTSSFGTNSSQEIRQYRVTKATQQNHIIGKKKMVTWFTENKKFDG